MGFFFSKKGSIVSDYFKVLEPIPGMPTGCMVEVALYDDRLEVVNFNSKEKNKATLSIGQINDVAFGTEKELVAKPKSPIGRAVVGGVLLGPIGAVVGGMSGMKDGQKPVYTTLLTIGYVGKNGDQKVLMFEDTRKHHGRKLAGKLREMLPKSEAAESSDIEL